MYVLIILVLLLLIYRPWASYQDLCQNLRHYSLAGLWLLQAVAPWLWIGEPPGFSRANRRRLAECPCKAWKDWSHFILYFNRTPYLICHRYYVRSRLGHIRTCIPRSPYLTWPTNIDSKASIHRSAACGCHLEEAPIVLLFLLFPFQVFVFSIISIFLSSTDFRPVADSIKVKVIRQKHFYLLQ